LAHPIAVELKTVNTNLSGTAFVGSATLEADESASTFKTVTLRNVSGTNSLGLLIKVHGY
jgi:hypothetical protein